MKRLLLAPFLLGLIPSANARVYYYPNYLEKGGVKVVCADGTITHTYERIDVRRRTKELTDIEFGSKKGNPETISLFDE